jgi:hypothetical protein
VPVLAPKADPVIYEQGDRVYLISAVTPVEPSDEEIAGYAFGSSVIDEARRHAPNPHIGWFGGHYVEADNPNANGAMWRAGEIGIKSLTPMFMPVTVMHDFRSAVGLIADTRLMTPEKDQVPRAKIDTVLALWKHRFPEVYDEALHNYEAGTLMQSMECVSPDYECSECGRVFHKLPGSAEKENWCDHLAASDPSAGYISKAGETTNASRILRNVVFTGTGLIFGTRGATGADGSAYLQSFHEEVAEFHQKVHAETATGTRSRIPMGMIQVEESEHSRIKAERDAAQAKVTELEGKLSEAASKQEKTEADLAKAQADVETANKKVGEMEESARANTLRDERLGKLGEGFTAKINSLPTVKERLPQQAAELSDDEWAARVKEIEELTGVKADAAKGDNPAGPGAPAEVAQDLFTEEEVAASKTADGAEPAPTATTTTSQSPETRRSVVAGL